MRRSQMSTKMLRVACICLWTDAAAAVVAAG